MRRRVRPEFHQLDIFLKVVEAGTFAGAARLVGLTQPAISQAIARLEDIYGGDLFERRRGAPLALTPIGEAILPSARVLLLTVDQHMARAVAAAQSRLGSLTIGMSPGLGGGLLGRGIAEFASAHSDVRLHFVEAASRELARMLGDRSIDIAFGFGLGSADGSVDREALFSEQLAVVVQQDHPLAARTSLSWSEVALLELQLSGSDDFGTLLGQRSGDALPRCTVHDVSRSTLLQMVAMGMGAAVGFLSSAPGCAGLVELPIDEPDATVPIEAGWVARDSNPIRHRLLGTVRRKVAEDS